MFSSWHNPPAKKNRPRKKCVTGNTCELCAVHVMFYQPDAWDDWDDSESQEKSIQHGTKWQTPYVFWDRTSIGMVEDPLLEDVRSCLQDPLCLLSQLSQLEPRSVKLLLRFFCSWCTRPKQRLDLRFLELDFSFLAVLSFCFVLRCCRHFVLFLSYCLVFGWRICGVFVEVIGFPRSHIRSKCSGRPDLYS